MGPPGPVTGFPFYMSNKTWCKPPGTTCPDLRPPFETFNQNSAFSVGPFGKSQTDRLLRIRESGARNFGFQFPGVQGGNCTNAEGPAVS
jgi:hypothetical protein